MKEFFGKMGVIYSFLGFLGGFLVPLFGYIDSIYFNDVISGNADLSFFIISFILTIIGLSLGAISKSKREEKKYGKMAIIFGMVGILINGFWLFFTWLSTFQMCC